MVVELDGRPSGRWQALREMAGQIDMPAYASQPGL